MKFISRGRSTIKTKAQTFRGRNQHHWSDEKKKNIKGGGEGGQGNIGGEKRTGVCSVHSGQDVHMSWETRHRYFQKSSLCQLRGCHFISEHSTGMGKGSCHQSPYRKKFKAKKGAIGGQNQLGTGDTKPAKRRVAKRGKIYGSIR